MNLAQVSGTLSRSRPSDPAMARGSKREAERAANALGGWAGIRPVYPDADTRNAIREGTAEYTVNGAIAMAMKVVYGATNGKYLDRSRPFGFVRQYDRTEIESIISDVMGDWWIRRSAPPKEGSLTSRFSFGIAAAKADKVRNRGRGYWQVTLSGIREGSDGIRVTIPIDRYTANEWRRTRNIVGYTDIIEHRIGVRSFGDARRAALVSGIKDDQPAMFDTIDNRTVAEREASETVALIERLTLEAADTLTPAEYDVLLAVSRGGSLADHARSVGINRASVSDTLSRVKRKVRAIVDANPETYASLAG